MRRLEQELEHIHQQELDSLKDQVQQTSQQNDSLRQEVDYYKEAHDRFLIL